MAALDDGRDVMVGDRDHFFAAPASEAALADLYLRHPDAWLVAGATDLGLAVTKALAEPRKVIWLGRVRELAEIERTGSELVLGAGVSLARAMPLLAGIDADLGEIMRRFGSPQVRASGTVGGNIANGSPIGDLAPCLIALGARLELRVAPSGVCWRWRISSSPTRSRIADPASTSGACTFPCSL